MKLPTEGPSLNSCSSIFILISWGNKAHSRPHCFYLSLCMLRILPCLGSLISHTVQTSVEPLPTAQTLLVFCSHFLMTDKSWAESTTSAWLTVYRRQGFTMVLSTHCCSCSTYLCQGCSTASHPTSPPDNWRSFRNRSWAVFSQEQWPAGHWRFLTATWSTNITG